MYKAIKNLYQHNKLTREGVADKVRKGFISQAQYQEITGEPFPVEA